MPLDYPPGVVADWLSNIRFGEEVVANLQIFVDNYGGPEGLPSENRVWLQHRLRKVPVEVQGLDGLGAPVTETTQVDMINFLVCGDVKAGLYAVKQLQPDAMDRTYHCLSQQLVDDLRHLLEDFLGLPLTNADGSPYVPPETP